MFRNIDFFHLTFTSVFCVPLRKSGEKNGDIFRLHAPKLHNSQKITHWANKSNIQNFNRLPILFYCSPLFLQSALLPTSHGDCIKIFTSSSTKPAPQKAPSISADSLTEKLEAIRGSFKLPPPALKHTTYPHLFHSASQFLLKPASVFLCQVKSSVYILSPFPQKSCLINYILSLLCLLTYHLCLFAKPGHSNMLNLIFKNLQPISPF